MIRARSATLRSAAGAAAALLCAAADGRSAARADDAVDLELAANAKVVGTIRPSYERERFLLRLGSGTKVLAVAKAKAKKGAFVPRLDFADPSDEVLATGVVSGRGSKLAGGPVASGGTHSLRVFGDGSADGDYSLSVTLKPQKGFTGQGTSVPGEYQLTYRFGAPAGAKARIFLKPGAGKTFVPSLDGLDGPAGEHVALTGTSSAPVLLGSSGDWTVGFHDGGSVGGEWTCQVVLTLPKLRRTTIDISASALTGGFGGEQPVYGRLVDDDGALLDPPDSGGPLDGASVSIPPGGMPYPVVVTMSPAPQFGGTGGNQPAGPAIQFGPPGTQFNPGKDATIRLPYDPTRFNDPTTELTVYVMDEETGLVSAVAKPYDFSTPGVVTFPAPHFSVYMATGVTPRPVHGTWVVASYEAQQNPDFGTQVDATAGTLDLNSNEDTFTIGLSGRRATWSRFDVVSNGPAAQGEYASSADAGSFSDSGTTLFLTPAAGGGSDQLVRVPGGDVLLRKPIGGDHDVFAIALRATVGAPTPANLAGRYTLFVFYRSAQQHGGGQTPDVRLTAELAIGTAVFREDKSISISVPEDVQTESAFPDGAWQTKRARFNTTGAFDVSDEILSVQFQGDGPGGEGLGPPMRLRPCLDGEVLVGAPDATGEDPALFFFVREGRNLRASALDGPTSFVATETRFVDAASAVEAQRMTFSGTRGVGTFDGSRNLSVSLLPADEFAHSTSGSPTTNSVPAQQEDATYTLSAAGAYRSSTGFRGALSPSGRLLIAGRAAGSAHTLFFGIPGADVMTPR